MRLAECHPEKPLKSRGLCSACYARDMRIKNPNMVSQELKSASDYQRRNRVSATQRQKEWRMAITLKNPNYNYGVHLKFKYGITYEQYLDMQQKQNGVCAICAQPPVKKLFVDHCHTTGKVRGLLCHSCNSYLGRLERNKNSLQRLIQYTKDHNATV